MIQSDIDIQGLLVNQDLRIKRDEGKLHIGPGSIDLHLADDFKVPDVNSTNGVRVSDKDTYPEYKETDGVIEPLQFMLGTTQEWLELPKGLSAFIWGRSSVGRLGVFIHNAGFTDPGYEGELTLELYNISPHSIELEPGMRICQITLHEYENLPSMSYGVEGKYQGQKGTTISKLHEDFQ